jgi:hypothetical protein
MPQNKITDLRNHLFATLEQLRDEEHPMDIARANAIANVAQKIIDSAVVEVKFIQATSAAEDVSGFFEDKLSLPAGPQPFENLRRTGTNGRR